MKNLNKHSNFLGVISTIVPDSPHKIFIGGLPNYLNEDQVNFCWKLINYTQPLIVGFQEICLKLYLKQNRWTPFLNAF